MSGELRPISELIQALEATIQHLKDRELEVADDFQRSMEPLLKAVIRWRGSWGGKNFLLHDFNCRALAEVVDQYFQSQLAFLRDQAPQQNAEGQSKGRCRNCDHEISLHFQGGCSFSMRQIAGSRNLVCACHWNPTAVGA